jgi:hypothetical protein
VHITVLIGHPDGENPPLKPMLRREDTVKVHLYVVRVYGRNSSDQSEVQWLVLVITVMDFWAT